MMTTLLGASIGGLILLVAALIRGDERAIRNYRQAVIPLVVLTWIMGMI